MQAQESNSHLNSFHFDSPWISSFIQCGLQNNFACYVAVPASVVTTLYLFELRNQRKSQVVSLEKSVTINRTSASIVKNLHR